MHNSYDEIDIKRILKAMEDANKKPTLYNKSGKPKGYYADKVKKAKEKPEHEKKRNDLKNLEQLAHMHAIRQQNLLKKKAELPKKQIEFEAEKVKEKLLLEKLKKEKEQEQKQKEKENQRKEILDLINEQFKSLKFDKESKPEQMEKQIQQKMEPKIVEKVIEKVVEKPSKYSAYSNLYN